PLLRRALIQAQAESTQPEKLALERLSQSYLLEEITQVIIARQIASLDGYIMASRSGRKVRFNETQRKVVWRTYTCLSQLLKQAGLETWQQRRVRAEVSFTYQNHQPYDAVVVDEAQDLDPS